MNEGQLSDASVQEQNRVWGWAAVAGALSSGASSDFVIVSPRRNRLACTVV